MVLTGIFYIRTLSYEKRHFLKFSKFFLRNIGLATKRKNSVSLISESPLEDIRLLNDWKWANNFNRKISTERPGKLLNVAEVFTFTELKIFGCSMFVAFNLLLCWIPPDLFTEYRQQQKFSNASYLRVCNACSPIKVKENFTPPTSVQRFQICPDIVFVQLTFVNCIIRYTIACRCITCCSYTPDN